MNVQDLFRGNATQEVLQIFKERLWRDSTDVYITRIAAPIDVGGRLPVDPRDKEGYANPQLISHDSQSSPYQRQWMKSQAMRSVIASLPHDYCCLCITSISLTHFHVFGPPFTHS